MFTQEFAQSAYNVHLLFDSRVFLFFSIILLLVFLKNKEKFFFKAYLGGLIVAGGLLLSIKEALQIPRPSDALIDLPGYAMPSAHAGFGFFWATFLTNYFLKCDNTKSMCRRSKSFKWLLIVGVWLFAIIVACSRVILNVHTLPQVIMGAIIGMFSACVFWKK